MIKMPASQAVFVKDSLSLCRVTFGIVVNAFTKNDGAYLLLAKSSTDPR